MMRQTFQANRAFGEVDRKDVWLVERIGEPLFGSVTRFIAKVRRTSGATRKADQAIAFLQLGPASLDQLEWAERYLCGMTDTDALDYQQSQKRWQS